MANTAACTKIRKMLTSQFRKAFSEDLGENLKQRSQYLWLVGIDSQNKTLIDICGSISPEDLFDINSKGFLDADAGYRVDAQTALGLKDAKVDIFLINTEHFNARPDFIEPIIVHELAHLLEQIGRKPEPHFNDEENAAAIIKSLHPNLLHPNLRHNEQWALHLAIGARTVLSKRTTNHKTIRAYLEAAIPHYDRRDPIKAAKGWS